MTEPKLILVFLVTQNVDSLLLFYRDILGLQLIEHKPGHSAWFDTGSVKLVLHHPESDKEGDADYLPEASIVIWFHPGEAVSIAAEKLASSGVALLQAKEARNYFYFRDPEGRLLGLHQP